MVASFLPNVTSNSVYLLSQRSLPPWRPFSLDFGIESKSEALNNSNRHLWY